LFKEFQRLHSNAHFVGSGVGLASCRHIIEMHGGSIRSSAEAGRGAAFYFSLPPAGAVAKVAD
jgi:signal transduction histidine kinase